jgi:hypothetical protein
MGLLLQLFVLVTFAAVLHSAPLDDHSESTTVGIKPLPAVLSKKDNQKESDEDKSDVKRIARNSPTNDQQSKDSLSTTQTPRQFGNRPVRDVPHFISGVPSPTDSQQRPTPQPTQQKPTESRKLREAEEVRGAPPAHGEIRPEPYGVEHKPAAPGAAAPPPPPPVGGAPPPPPPVGGAPPPPPPAPVRPKRDTNSPVKPQVRPAPLPGKPVQKPETKTNGAQTNNKGRPARDVSTPLTSSTTQKSAF